MYLYFKKDLLMWLDEDLSILIIWEISTARELDFCTNVLCMSQELPLILERQDKEERFLALFKM